MPYSEITHDSRHPFETYLLAAGVVAGAFAVGAELWPSSIEDALPKWLQIVWGVHLGGGAALALYGIGISNRPRGILLEQVGLSAFGGACFVYGGLILAYRFSPGFTSAALFLLMAAASFRQWWRLEKFVRKSIVEGRRVRRWRGGN